MCGVMAPSSSGLPVPRQNRRFRTSQAIVATALVTVLAACGLLWIFAQTPNGGSPWNVLGFGSFRTYGAVMLNPGEHQPPLVSSAEQGVDVGECAGVGEFADLRAGTRVAVLDTSDTVL